jgi:glycosyltransferase involved in cell wall biosynthesis
MRYSHQLYRNYTVGFYFWEFEDTPKHWTSVKEWTDEIWVQSDFMLNTFKKMSSDVYKIPFSLDVNPNYKKNRRYFKLPNDKFIFLFTFDFWSCYKRKNPEAVIRAFKKAFGKRKDVHLLIKTTHGEHLISDMNRLISFIGDASNIELRNTFISDEDQYSLINQCDAYISLHRSEGLGLGMAEAMCLKKPVIATNYSGNLEFMNKKNSCLVDYTLIPHDGSVTYPDSKGQLYAEPDSNHAAFFMKKIKDNPVFRNKIATQAASDMKKYNAENFQKAILERIQHING